MPRGHELIGLPVLAGPRLKRIGRIQEVLVDTETRRICGLMLAAGDWLHSRRVLDYRAVRQISDTHVLAEEIYLSGEAPSARCCQDLRGLPVLTGEGLELGIMDDFHFQLPDGQVTALQLSRGLVDDLLNGKAVAPLTGAIVAGEAAILLDGPGEFSGGALH